jgi:hypothetical protein
LPSSPYRPLTFDKQAFSTLFVPKLGNRRCAHPGNFCSLLPFPDVRFGSKADIAERDPNIRKVPEADIALLRSIT